MSVTALVSDLIDQIESSEHIPVHQQRLIFMGKQLDGDQVLAELVRSETTDIYLVRRHTGG
jgi:hypothetical protein